MSKTAKHILQAKIKDGTAKYKRNNKRAKFNRRKVEMPVEAEVLKNAPIVKEGTFKKVASWLGF